MSLRVHCDECDKYYFQTAVGRNYLTRADFGSGATVLDELCFCSEECLQKWVRREILQEAEPECCGHCDLSLRRYCSHCAKHQESYKRMVERDREKSAQLVPCCCIDSEGTGTPQRCHLCPTHGTNERVMHSGIGVRMVPDWSLGL